MADWLLYFDDKPDEPGDYLVFGIAGKPIQWIEKWDGSAFTKFPKRKVVRWMKIPMEGWHIYPESKPEKDGRYIVFIVWERVQLYKIMHFNYFKDGRAKFIRDDAHIAAYHTQPEDPEF